jgi:predicted transcriptional regulator
VVANSTSSVPKLQAPHFDSATKPSFTLGLEEPIHRFVGRNKELTELKSALTCDTEREQLRLAAGPGGMGKSQLMKKFLCDVKNENNCVWLHGESNAHLKNSVHSLFKKLHQHNTLHQETLPAVAQNNGEDSISSQLNHILDSISTSLNERPWIFVIDNIDETYDAAKTVINTLIQRSNIKTFVTSRLRNIVGGSYDAIVEVKQLSDEDAQTFIHRSLQCTCSSERVSELCMTLQNHPLALNQAVDYIKEAQSWSNEKYCIADYLVAFHTQTKSLLNQKGYGENLTVFNSYQVSVKRIRTKHGGHAIAILHRLAYFDPDGVSLPFVVEFLKRRMFWSSRFEEGLALLNKFSLIWIKDNLITVHRLVQQIARIEDQSFWFLIQNMKFNLDRVCFNRIDQNHFSDEIVKQNFSLLQNQAKQLHLVVAQGLGYNHSVTIRNFLRIEFFLLCQNKLEEAEQVIEYEIASARKSSSGEKKNSLFIMKLQTRLLRIHLIKGNEREADELKKDLWIRSEDEFGKDNKNTFKVKREVMRAFKILGQDIKANEIEKEIEGIIRYRKSCISKCFKLFKENSMITWIMVSKMWALIGLGWIIQYSYDNWDFKVSVDPWGL